MPPTNTLSPLTGSERALRAGSRLIGPSNPEDRIDVTVRVRSRSQKPFSAGRIGMQWPRKRHYLGRAEFASIYGAAPGDVTKLKSFASKNGLDVVSVDRAQRQVILSGSVQTLSKAFQVKLMEYGHPDGNYRGRIGPVHLPAELLPIVSGVFGLDNRRMAYPHIVMRPETVQATAALSYTAMEVAQLYDFPTGLDGRGECIGILEFGGGYNPNDLAKYFTQLRISAPSVTSVSVQGATNRPGINADEDAEVALDIEVAGAIAPGAKIVVYFTAFTERGWVDGLTAAVNDAVNKPSVISISWGFAEGEPFQGFEWTPQTVKAVNETIEAAAGMGVSICVSSGDDGSNAEIGDGLAHVVFPASSPYVLGCGGTKLTAANGKIVSEVVWNEGLGSGGGGGVSDMNPLPPWQAGIVPPSVNPTHHVGRGVPDVCGDGGPQTGYQIVCRGKHHVVGGTSAVAPLWAGLLARINQKLGKPVGYFNPLLYSKLGNSAAFHDITKGNNDTTGGQIGGYSAGKGWDACSGWGSPDGAKLLQEFSASGVK